MNRRQWLACLGLLAILPAQALEKGIQGTSWHQRRFRNIDPQAYDQSCGASTLAALVTRYTDLRWNESDVIKGLVDIVPAERQEVALKEGFSLLDIKLLLKKFNYDLKAVRYSHEQQLIEFASPAILQLQFDEGKHFVLWHGKYRGYHWISDPSRGEMWMSDQELFSNWTMLAAWIYKDEKRVSGSSQAEFQKAFSLR